MTEDKLSLEQTSINQSSISKNRKKTKWDQPAESLVSCGAVVSGILPLSTVGGPSVSLPGAFSSSCAPSTTSINVGYASVQASVGQQQAVAVVQKLNQPKIQEDLIIAREIVINDADPAMRYKLTKRQTQEEIQKSTGAVVITRGKYRPPNAPPDGEKPLYLHISAGVHIKETAERILAVDRAAAMVEDILKQVSQLLSTCVYLGFDADPSLNIAARIRGPNDQYINHIMNETGVSIVLRGRGSGYFGNTQGEDVQQPLHLLLSSNNQKSLEDAKLLAENLMDTISRECGANRVSSCKVYGAVPPPQQLLVGAQSSGTDMHPISSSVTNIATTSGNRMPGVPVPPFVPPVVPPSFSYAQVVPPGPPLPLHPQTNGLSFSQPISTACTSYGVYAGIYPQATPLQQVAIALRQSGPVSSTVASPMLAKTAVPKGSLESEKRAPPKRKFQESPVALKGSAISPQDSNLKETYISPPNIEKKNDGVHPPVSLKSLLPPPPRSNTSERSSVTKSMPPPPPPSKSMLPSPPPHPRSMHPPPPPPPPKFGSSVSVNGEYNKDNSGAPSIPTVPDTLVKLMEYGDDDDDDDVENESGFLKNGSIGGAPSKPFWAVK